MITTMSLQQFETILRSGIQGGVIRKLYNLKSWTRLHRRKRVRLPPTDWWDTTIYRFYDQQGGVHDFIV